MLHQKIIDINVYFYFNFSCAIFKEQLKELYLYGIWSFKIKQR